MDLFKALKPTAHLSKNGFDLSRKHVFSSKAGQALPCLAVETVPGDHFEIDLASLSRTETFNTAAFLRGKQRYDFFFVPYTQLWHPFNQFISQRDDRHSTTQNGHIYCPVISLRTIIEFIHLFYSREEQFLDGTMDIMGFSRCRNLIRLLDLLGYGNFEWLLSLDYDSQDWSAIKEAYADKYVNVFRLAAYQHIWYDYYRNKYYDVENTGGIDTPEGETYGADYVRGFNFDDILCNNFASSVIPWGNVGTPEFYRLRTMFDLHYIQWKKDIFTSALPSQQFGAVSSVDIVGKNILSQAALLTTGSTFVSAVNNKFTVSESQSSSSLETRQSWNIPSAFDVLTLRKAEALQQWKQATLRAGNMTDDSFKAHFGVEPYYSADENVNYLGSFSASLQVNAVESTSSTGQSVNGKVGDLAATGTCLVNGNKIKFDCRDYGVIMCIASFLPESEYKSNALDKANTLYEQFDFFTPEFQNIGLEAVSRSECSLYDIASANAVIGYSPRYHQYKTAVDKCFGEFADTSAYLDSTTEVYSHVGSLKAWVSPRAEHFTNDGQRYLKTFYVNPSVYNNTFGVRADDKQTSDQFLNNVYFDIKAIRPMSVLGLPEF